MKKTLIWFIKAVAAGIIALTVLSLFCILYYNPPIHYACADGATDYVWESDTFYSKWTEGYGRGRTNNEGYINQDDYESGMPIDILIMGSSHMEAHNVTLEESTAERLGALLPDRTVYNIGTSGHTLPICADNLKAALTKYAPSDYVIIETRSLEFSDEQLRGAIGHELTDIPSYSDGIMGFLQKSPFLMLCYYQLSSYLDHSAAQDDASVPERPYDPALMNTMLAQMAEEASAAGTRLIIFFHPATSLRSDGTLQLAADPETVEDFSTLCAQNGILFTDLSERFAAEYEARHILPYGFSNSSVGSGHLNAAGHAMIADRLYELIRNEE